MVNRYFAGNKLASYFRTIPGIAESTSSSTFDSGYVANSIAVPNVNEYMQTAAFVDASSATTFWLHFEFYTLTWPGGSFPWVTFVNGSGTVVAQLLHNGSNDTAQFQYWNGAAFVNYGAAFTITGNVLYRMDVKIVCGSSGTIDIWKAGTSVASANSGMSSAVDNIAAVRFYGVAAPGNGFYSQLFGLDFDTRDLRLIEPAINGEGTHTDGSGAYTSINETPIDESTGIVLPAVNDMHTFTKAGVTVPAGYIIDSAWVNARLRVSGGVVTDGELVFRSGGTDYPSAGKSVAAAYEPRMYYSATDPATGVAWTQSGYNNAEVGVKAV